MDDAQNFPSHPGTDSISRGRGRPRQPENFLSHLGAHSVSHSRGRPRRSSQPIVTPEAKQSNSSYNQRRRTQLRNIG